MNFIVATTKPWNIKAFKKYSKQIHGKWYLITNNSDSEWIYQDRIPEAGYISYAGEILFTNDDYQFVR